MKTLILWDENSWNYDCYYARVTNKQAPILIDMGVFERPGIDEFNPRRWRWHYCGKEAWKRNHVKKGLLTLSFKDIVLDPNNYILCSKEIREEYRDEKNLTIEQFFVLHGVVKESP